MPEQLEILIDKEKGPQWRGSNSIMNLFDVVIPGQWPSETVTRGPTGSKRWRAYCGITVIAG